MMTFSLLVLSVLCGAAETAATADDLKSYTGKDAEQVIVGEARKRAFRCNYVQLFVNYANTVDFQLRQEQVVLCPRTAEFLYSQFTPLTVRYQKGLRPELERVVAEATAGCETEQAKALALMRYCRDLYKEEWYTEGMGEYVYGGTEEQLIEKGEILCECLGRLHVGLCEIAGIPGRIVMHVVGGHICSEVYVDGHWAYMDPRCGVYFRKPDGALASVLDLCQDPSIIRAQSDDVKADVSRWFTWEERAWKCEHKYFDPREINGFENYSLADSARYSFAQKSHKQAVDDGLLVINKDYGEAINETFGLEGDGFRLKWGTMPLRKLPIAYRNDGFSIFFKEPPMTRERLFGQYVDPLANKNVTINVWGVGPGSVFCYDTKAGEVFGQGLTPEQMGMLREGDRWVNQNVMDLIRSGNDPLRIAAERGRELGLKTFARLEMNHEYGPAKDDNWMWVAFVGRLNKEHPQFRIPNTVLLDFKHQTVRDFKLAIFREAFEAGADGLELDFAVYPPFFEDPVAGTPVLTQFLRDVRALAKEWSAKQGRPIELMARVPARNALELGLDWKTWMQERLIDYIVPTHYRPNEQFDINVDEFVSMGHRTGVKVYPTIWQVLGFVDTDEQPEDDKTGNRRYDKPKTKEMFFAQALLFHRAGVDGIELGFSEDQWCSMPYLNDLAEPEKVEFAGKHYMVDVWPHGRIEFPLPEAEPFTCEKTVPLRIGDDIPKAQDAGYTVTAAMALYATPMEPGDTLSVYINGRGPATVSANETAEAEKAPVDPGNATATGAIFEKEWWRKGELRIPVRAEWWNLGQNDIRFVFAASPNRERPFHITWVDLLLDYETSR